MSSSPIFTRASNLDNMFTFRDAEKADLDAMTQIHVEGFTEEPYIHYCFPFRNKHPEDYWKWTRKEYENDLNEPKKWAVHVIDAAVQIEDTTVNKPVGLAVWDLAVLTKAEHTDIGIGERHDINKERLVTFQEVASKRFETYFKDYAEKQVYLSILVVHPDFRRHGGGTMLVDWGMKEAAAKGWPVSLLASPMGRLLYRHLGFEEIGTEVVQLEGEKDSLESFVMVNEVYVKE